MYDALNNNKLPNLSSLGLDSIESARNLKYSEPISIDRFLHINSLILSGFPILNNSSMRDQLNYSELIITFCDRNLSDVIEKNSFPFLKRLVIHSCALTKENIRSLVEANQEGRLPQLKHLDISDNGLSRIELESLFLGGCTWNHLLSLNMFINENLMNPGSILDCLNRAVSRGCLSSLQELAIDYFWVHRACWSHLRKLYLSVYSLESLNFIADSADQGFLPVLSSVCLKNFYFTENTAHTFRRLSEKGILIHQRIIPVDDPFSIFNCVCQTGLIDNMSISLDTDKTRSAET